ncbi:MAG: hypothetical protein ABI445_24205 [Polyangia bacterium]
MKPLTVDERAAMEKKNAALLEDLRRETRSVGRLMAAIYRLQQEKNELEAKLRHEQVAGSLGDLLVSKVELLGTLLAAADKARCADEAANYDAITRLSVKVVQLQAVADAASVFLGEQGRDRGREPCHADDPTASCWPPRLLRRALDALEVTT